MRKLMTLPSRIVGRLRRFFYDSFWEKRQLCRVLSRVDEKTVFLFGTPLHQNLGDSAITIAQIEFLKKAGIPANHIIEVTMRAYRKYTDLLKKGIPSGALLCGHGGGNMGNQWLSEELFRRDFLADFPENPVLIFPQTIYYTPDEDGRREMEKSAACYDGRGGVTLIARERRSEEIMRQLYPHTPVILTPDIVFSADRETFRAGEKKRRGILLCRRSDPEKAVDDAVWERLKETLGRKGLSFRETDMFAEKAVTKKNRRKRVKKKMDEFSGAELVITDRLHGMAFSALTGTPCIVFGNYNHKVKGSYDWIDYLPYIQYVRTVEEAESRLPMLLKMKNCFYDSTPLRPYFARLTAAILGKTQNENTTKKETNDAGNQCNRSCI